MRRLLVFCLLLSACTSSVELENGLVPVVATDAGTPAGIPVVYVNGAAQHISIHNFWPAPGTQLGAGMRWEAIAQGAPWNPSGYLIADGYGGEHALLFSGSSGNIIFDQGMSAEQIVSFSSLDLPPNGVFSHVQVAIQNDPYGKPSIVVRQNGIPVSRTFIPLGAHRTAAGSGAGTNMIGGSDHSNWVGYIDAIRGWDTVPALDVGPTQAMIPARYFDSVGPAGEPADFLMSFVSPYLITYPDLSGGYDGNGTYRRTQHPGVPAYGLDYADVWWDPPIAPTNLPTIKYVTNAPFDPTYNETATGTITALKRGCTKDATPAGAKIFDSFCRPDREFFHNQRPDIGSVEVDTVGTNPRWQTGSTSGVPASVPTPGTGQNYAVGLYNRSPVTLDYMPVDMWVPSNSGDATVSVTRRSHVGTSSDGQVGIAFRVQDEAHLWVFFFQNVQAGDGTIIDRHFYLMRFDGYGGAAFMSTADLPAGMDNFSRLSVTTSGSSITCSADGTPLITITDSTYVSATGFGLHLTSALSRAYDFTVF